MKKDSGKRNIKKIYTLQRNNPVVFIFESSEVYIFLSWSEMIIKFVNVVMTVLL